MPSLLQVSRLSSPLANAARGSLSTKPIQSRSLYTPTLRDKIGIHGTCTHSLRRNPYTPHYQTQRWQQTGSMGSGGASDYQFGPSNGLFGAPLPPIPKPSNKPDLIIDIQPGPDTQRIGGHGGGGKGGGKGGKSGPDWEDWKQTAFKMFEASATTAASIAVLGYEIVLHLSRRRVSTDR